MPVDKRRNAPARPRTPRPPILAALLAAFGLTFAAAAGEGQGKPHVDETAPIRVLMIGNSLTAGNDLPLLLEAMGRAASVPLSCTALTYPNFSLEDHWGRGARERIRGGGWTFVVLQQGPSSLPASRENLREWTRRFDAEIREVGATPALFMVWPDQSRRSFFPQVRDSYRLAAEDVGGVFLGVGEVWQAAWRRKPKLGLYGRDHFHPSRIGTWAAAVTILSRLTGHPPGDLPGRLKLSNGVDYRVDERDAAIVRAAVEEVVGRPQPD